MPTPLDDFKRVMSECTRDRIGEARDRTGKEVCTDTYEGDDELFTVYIKWKNSTDEEIDILAKDSQEARQVVQKWLSDPEEYIPGGKIVHIEPRHRMPGQSFFM